MRGTYTAARNAEATRKTVVQREQSSGRLHQSCLRDYSTLPPGHHCHFPPL